MYNNINLDIKERFDTSDYPTNHPSGIKTGHNSKVLGMFKDDAGGKQIVEIVGLRANFTLKKCMMALKIKYVRLCQRMLQKRVFHSMIIESLFSRNEQHRKMNVIRSHCHAIYTEEINKLPSLLTMTNQLLSLTEYTL